MKIQALKRFYFSFIIILALLVGIVSPALAATPPVIEVLEVVPGGLVKLRISNMPDNADFAVRMGPVGTQGIAGGLVAHFNSGSVGTGEYLFEIHESVRKAALVDVRIDAGNGNVAWKTFNNSKALPPVTAPATTPVPVASGGTTTTVTNADGTLILLNVQKGGWVKLSMINLPVNKTFTVRIGMAGTGAVNGLGYVVAHFDTTSTGAQTGTFEIPFALRAQARLDFRIETTGFSRMLSFDNVDK
jgi:hypothetical protein